MLRFITYLSPPSGLPAVLVLAGHGPDDSQHARLMGKMCEHFSLLTGDWE